MADHRDDIFGAPILGVHISGNKRRCGACDNGWVTVEERLPCGSCNGTRVYNGKKCMYCNGTGYYSRMVRRFCKVCNGTGWR